METGSGELRRASGGELIGAAEDPARLEGEWDELAQRAAAAPFSHPGWVLAWWRAFGRGRLEIRTVRRADRRLAAVLPLARRRGALVSPTNWHTPTFDVLAEDDDAAAALIDGVLAERPRRLSLGFLPPQRAELVRAAGERAGSLVLVRTLQRAPHVPIEGGWERYERDLGRNLRNDLRRRRRRLAEQRGEFELAFGADDRAATAARLDALLAEGFAVEAAGWKGRAGSAILSNPRTRRFYAEIAHWAAARGWLRLAFVRVAGRPLAFDLGLEHAGVHYLVKTGYDPAASALSPGKLIRGAMIERAFQSDLTRYELLGDAEPWKLQWTQCVHLRELVQVFRRSSLGRLDWIVAARVRPLARRLRERGRALVGERHGAPEELPVED